MCDLAHRFFQASQGAISSGMMMMITLCDICTPIFVQREGERVCNGCGDKIYCVRCWNADHKDDDSVKHRWKGADSGEIFVFHSNPKTR